MPRITIYEDEPGDWNFSEELYGYFTEVTDQELAELRDMQKVKERSSIRSFVNTKTIGRKSGNKEITYVCSDGREFTNFYNAAL